MPDSEKPFSYFSSRQKLLKLAASGYLVLLVVSHWQLPQHYVWVIAAFFSIVMNFTYLTEAVNARRFVTTETLVATNLIILSVAGVFVSPLFVIAAIFGHGLWDLAKHFGRGIPFFFWYTCSCFIVDAVYSAALLVYLLKGTA